VNSHTGDAVMTAVSHGTINIVLDIIITAVIDIIIIMAPGVCMKLNHL